MTRSSRHLEASRDGGDGPLPLEAGVAPSAERAASDLLAGWEVSLRQRGPRALANINNRMRVRRASVGSAAPRGAADGRRRAVAGGFHSDIPERLRPRHNMRACDRALSGEHLPDRPAGGAGRELLERIPRALHAVERQRPPEALCERDCLRQLLYVQHNREEPDRVVGELHHAVRSRAHPTAQLIPGVHELGPGRRLRRERHAGLVLGSGALGSIVRGASAVDRAPSDRRPGAPAVGLHVLGYRRSGCNCSGRRCGRRRHPGGRGDAARAIDGEGSRRPHNRVPEEERRVGGGG